MTDRVCLFDVVVVVIVVQYDLVCRNNNNKHLSKPLQ